MDILVQKMGGLGELIKWAKKDKHVMIKKACHLDRLLDYKFKRLRFAFQILYVAGLKEAAKFRLKTVELWIAENIISERDKNAMVKNMN